MLCFLARIVVLREGDEAEQIATEIKELRVGARLGEQGPSYFLVCVYACIHTSNFRQGFTM